MNTIKETIFDILGTITWSEKTKKAYMDVSLNHATGEEFLALLQSPLILKALATGIKPSGSFSDNIINLLDNTHLRDEWFALIDIHICNLSPHLEAMNDRLLTHYIKNEMSRNHIVEEVELSTSQYAFEGRIIEKLEQLFSDWQIRQKEIASIRFFLEVILLTESELLDRNEFVALIEEYKLDLTSEISLLT